MITLQLLAEEVDVFDLDEYLQDFLAEEFHCEAEDGSTRQVLEVIRVIESLLKWIASHFFS